MTHWYYRFQSLLHQCEEPQGRRKLYKALAALNDCLLDHNSLKLSLARQLITSVFAVKEGSYRLHLFFLRCTKRSYSQLVTLCPTWTTLS